MEKKVTFRSPDKSFHRVLKQRVDAYFLENNISKRADWRMPAKAVFWFSLLFGAVGIFTAGVLPMWAAFLAFQFAGFIVAQIGFNVGHDAVHGSWSDSATVNKLLSWTFDLIGANAHTWSVAHNWIHHTYTNIPNVDGDLEPGPFMRFHTEAPKLAMHRYQHIFAWPLYTFATMVWLFQKDWAQIITPDPRTGKIAPPIKFVELLVGKILHVAVFFAVPLVFSPYPAIFVVASYLSAHLVAGFTLALVFQLAHVVEGPAFPVPDEDRVLHDDWAAHQMRTTANFSTDGWMGTFLTGGLNHQVEHHLFPRVSHIHYPDLQPIVKQTAAEFGIPYYDNGSFWSAVKSHYRVLKILGRGEDPAIVRPVTETEAAFAKAA